MAVGVQNKRTSPKALAKAIVNLAVADIQSGDNRKYWHALAWLTGTEKRLTSFEQCCEVLEVPPVFYRRRLLQECGVIPKPVLLNKRGIQKASGGQSEDKARMPSKPAQRLG